jgi:MinD-like ATPase involved in chromosome partitioning or flagellar assembly
MALIAVASDKGSPGVTTTALALASVWPGPVLLAECDPAGGDLMFRFPGADGRQLDPRRGLLSLAVAGRRDYQQQQVWQHTQKIHGGLDVLLGVTNAEQGAGLSTLWGPLARMLSALPGTDVIADCGRVGPDGPFYDLLAEADAVLLVTRPELGDIIRLRDRAAAVVTDAVRRGRSWFAVDVLTIADPQRLKTAEAEVTHALAQAGLPVRLSCGIADDRRGAELLRGTWGGKLDKSLLIRTAREAVGQLAAVRIPAAAEVQQPPGQAGPASDQPPPYSQSSPGYSQPSPGYGEPPAGPVTAPGPPQAARPFPQHAPPAPPAPPASPAPPPGPVPTFHPRHAAPGSPVYPSSEQRPPTYAEGLQPDSLRGT